MLQRAYKRLWVGAVTSVPFKKRDQVYRKEGEISRSRLALCGLQQEQRHQSQHKQEQVHLGTSGDMGYDAEYSFVPVSVTSKQDFYDHVLDSLKGLLAVQDGEKHDWVSALSSVSSVLFNAYADFPSHFGTARRVNWAGFYMIPPLYPSSSSSSSSQLYDPTNLLLGPYQGRPGCLQIPLKNKRKGVCAESFLSKKVVTVPDVHQVPGHIACDASTQCEIVVPLEFELPDNLRDKDHSRITLGVLDIDCQRADSWSAEDEDGLRNIISWLMQADGVVDWSSAIQRSS